MGHVLGTRSQMKEYRGPLVGLAILLALLGHDALMATGAHAVWGPLHAGHEARMSERQEPSVHTLATASTSCGMVPTAALQETALLRRALLTGDTVWGGSNTRPADLVRACTFADRAPDPTRPPGVRRALLQVFLI